MLSKNKIKYINSLKISKYRKLNADFFVEGTKLIAELLQSNFQISGIYATNEWLQENNEILKNTDCMEVDSKELMQISNLTTPPGVLAVVKIPDVSFEPLSLVGRLSLMLDGINDPGNLGTIIRTADWFGVSQIFCSPDTVDAYHPKVVQSTMGSIFRVKVIETDLMDVCQEARKNQVDVFGAVMNGQNIYESKLKGSSSVLIIGSESHGIRNHLLPYINFPITFPAYSVPGTHNKTESLNASVAAALILSEFRRKAE
jgi:RNA methyltransferase, TrmH family